MAANVQDIFGESDEEEEVVAPQPEAPGDVLADADLDEPLAQLGGASPGEDEEGDTYQQMQMLVERPSGPPLEIEVPSNGPARRVPACCVTPAPAVTAW